MSTLLVTPARCPLPRIPCPPPAPATISRFGLLLRRLTVLQGWQQLRDQEPDGALALLQRCASTDEDHRAVRAFTPLVSSGLLQLLDRSGPERSAHAESIAEQVTISPRVLEQIAARLDGFLCIAPSPALETLALSQAEKQSAVAQRATYNSSLWLGVLALVGVGVAGLYLLAYGARSRMDERGGTASAPAPAPVAQAPSPAADVSAAAAPQGDPPRSLISSAPEPSPTPAALPSPTTAEAADATERSAAPAGLPVGGPGAAPAAAPVPTAASGPAAAVAPATGPASLVASGLRWKACDGLPSDGGSSGSWLVLAPATSLAEVRRFCRAEAVAGADGVRLARFTDRAAAEALVGVLKAETGQTFQVASLAQR